MTYYLNKDLSPLLNLRLRPLFLPTIYRLSKRKKYIGDKGLDSNGSKKEILTPTSFIEQLMLKRERISFTLFSLITLTSDPTEIQVALMETSLQDCDSTPGGVIAHFQFGSIRAEKFNLAIFPFYCNFYLFGSFLFSPISVVMGSFC